MIAGRTALASALCSILILQAISSTTPVQADSEWTGTIETRLKYTWTEFDGTRTVEITRGAEISFTVPKDPYSFGDVTGRGSGWEEYNLHYVVSDGSGECPESYDNGRTDVTFELRGYVDEDSGKAILEVRQLSPYQYIVDRGCVGPYDSTGYYVNAFDSWNSAGVEIDLYDGAIYEQDTSGREGFDRLVIHGQEDPVNHDECPTFTITPTSPPASNPRKTALPTDTISYRMQVAWDGQLPVRVNFDVAGWDDTIVPSFTFNPANMPSSPISVMMDVSTRHAEAGEYPITIEAWVIDPETGEECVSSATVILVVSEHLSDLPLFCKIDGIEGDVLIFKPTGSSASPEEGQEIETGDVIQTGIDGNLGISSEGEKIKLSRGTTAGTADLGVTPDGEADIVLPRLIGLEKDFPPVDDNQFWQDVAAEFVDAHKELGPQAIAAVAACNEAEGDLEILDCATHETYFFYEGYVYFANDEIQELSRITPAPGHLWVTPSAVVRSLSAEFSMVVSPDGTTTVTTLQGSVWVADAKSKASVFVESGEQIVIPRSAGGLSEGQIGQSVTTFDEARIDSWWSRPVNRQFQIGDYATATGLESADDTSTPVGRTAVFGDQDERVYVWIKFVNVLPPEHTVDFKWYQPDGALYGDSTIRMEEPGTYWSSYTLSDYITVKGNSAVAEKPGLWRVDVYSDGDLAKEIPFSIVEPTLVKDQFVKYEFIDEVKSSDEELATSIENEAASTFPESFTGVLAVSVETPDDIEWVRVTVKDNSPGEPKMQTEVKVRGQQRPLTGEPESDFSLPLFIPTIGIDKGYVLQTTGDESDDSAQIVLDKTVSLNIGGTTIQAYEFLGSSEGYTATVHYEKGTGILVGFLIDGKFEDETGYIEANFGLKAIEITMPTTLSMSLPDEIEQDKDLVVTGKISPATSEGQVILKYQKQDSDEPPVTRTVPVTDGTFSDTYKLGFGSYTVSAEYPGSGAYLSSATDAKILNVTFGEGDVIFYGIIILVVFLGIVAAIVIGIYFGIKKLRNRKKQGSVKQGM